MKILIFLPTYNEEENIGRMIDTMNRLNFNKEILIVDDNSTDETIEIINEKLKQFKDLTLIVRTDKKGRGLAGRLDTAAQIDLLLPGPQRRAANRGPTVG